MNHLIDFGVRALAGCTNFIILHNYFKHIFKAHFWVFKFDAILPQNALKRDCNGKCIE